MMDDNNSVRRRSPTSNRRDLSLRELTNDCDILERKEPCQNGRSVGAYRMFLLSPVFLLLFYFGNKRQSVPIATPVRQGSRRELHQSTPLTEYPVAEWTIPFSASSDIMKELLSLKWDKSSLPSMKTFIDQSKAIILSHWADNEYLWKVLRDLHDPSSPTAAVVIKNLPIDPDIPLAPTDGRNTLNKPTMVAEAILLALGELSGAKVVGYKAEVHYSNPWVHEGFPRVGVGSALTAADELSYHQDMSYQDRIPDILGLVCLREGHDTNVWTTLLDVREIIARLPEDIVEILRQPRFRIHTSDWVDASWSGSDQGRPMLSDYSLHLPVKWENMIGLDDEATLALALLQKAIVTTEPHKVHFESGMLLLFNNQRMVHGRTPYNDLRFDGGDRVVNRAYFRGELTPEEERTRMI